MISRFYRRPFRFVEAEGDGAAWVVDADGKSVAMMMWAGHAPEDEEAATQETYEVGRAFAASCDSGSDPQGENSRSEVEGEASQSGAAKTAHRPNESTIETPTP